MDYRKLFVITRELQKKRVPDDLMQRIFEYVGDLNETSEELQDKHAFCRIENLITGKTYMHYCYYCDLVLCYKTNKGLARHCDSQTHKYFTKNVKKKTTRKEIIDKIKSIYMWSSFWRKLNREVIKVVDVEYKKPV